MSLRTRLTEKLGITHPVISAPMAFAAGGALASAVTGAGGLGLIGGGYGDAEWLKGAFADAGNTKVGCGFITWSLAKQPQLLDQVIARSPAAVMLSFGDPVPFGPRVKQAGIPLICQTQTIGHVRDAIKAGADIIVAQGTEAGGHGASRSTLTFVPEAADLLAKESPSTILVAAGGIADGRGLAAALMLGAEGVLVGSRFWASHEAKVHPSLQAAAIEANGDATIRTSVVDIARELAWPKPFSARVMKNKFVDDWHGREAELAKVTAREKKRYYDAQERGDRDETGVWFGEAAGLMHDVKPAADIVRMISEEAEALLSARPKKVLG